ncbi:MAG TPA: response regulator transcription factor [Candidatus Acidoferrum sp.]|nr:response regulator transcription factor [Candidatus Acidoferrum sp.]
MRIFIAERDPSLGGSMERELRAANIAVDLVADGERVESAVLNQSYDAAILDADVSSPDGLDALRSIRALRRELPVLLLADELRPGERARVLDVGADDVLLKPFAFSELIARVRALVRRGGRRADPVLRIDNLELSRAEHVVTRAGRKIHLTPKEFALLEYLLANAGQHITRAEIVRHVWHYPGDPLTNIVDVYVNYLRKKVDLPFESKLIHTVRGVGYQLEARKSTGGRAA